MIDIIINLEAEAWEAEFEAQARRAAEATLVAILGETVTTSAATLELGITLSDDETVRALNRDHRGQDKPTNVLSFPLLDGPPGDGAPVSAIPGAPVLLGDVILARETVVREALEQGKSPADHATHLVVHGVLHLLGRDHETEAGAEIMERCEIAVLRDLGLKDPYAESNLSLASALEPP